MTASDAQPQNKVVGQRKRISNVVVHLRGSPDVFARYDVQKTDINEWRIDVEVEGEEALVETLGPADIFAFVDVSGLQPNGEPFLSVPVTVTIEPSHKGVYVVDEPRVVRVTLVPRTPGAP